MTVSVVDTVDESTRSRVMASVRSTRNQSTELRLMSFLRSAHIKGWRRSRPIFGRPDFAWPSQKIAVFVDGCFWHGCPRHLRLPASNRKYWRMKIARNVRHDKKVSRTLRQMGWVVIRIWECRLSAASTTRRIMQALLERRNLL